MPGVDVRVSRGGSGPRGGPKISRRISRITPITTQPTNSIADTNMTKKNAKMVLRKPIMRSSPR